MSPDQIEVFWALATGFAGAGLLTSGYELATGRAASFALLNGGARPKTFAVLPVVVFAAPFLILRGTLRAEDGRGAGFAVALVAMLVAGGWSLMSGTLVLAALAAL
jgi:hypothetical protein